MSLQIFYVKIIKICKNPFRKIPILNSFKQKILLLKTILRSDKDKPEDFFRIEYSVTRDKMEIERQEEGKKGIRSLIYV